MFALLERPRLLFPLLGCVIGVACQAPERWPRSYENYLEDLAQLETFTTEAYANFEWAVTEGGFDPAAAHREARRAIIAGRSEEDARQVLLSFVDSFEDGHFRLRSRIPETEAAGDPLPGPGPETPGDEACVRLGYVEHDQAFRLDFGAGFRPVTTAADPFPAGWLELAGGHRVGIVRIDEFGAHRFGEYCPEVWQGYRQGLAGPCDDWECGYAFRLEVIDRLLEEIDGRIDALAERGVSSLVVDVIGNGGGSDWVHPTAMLLTERTLLGNERSVVRHPHWRGIFEEMAADLDRELVGLDIEPQQRRLLETVRARLAEAIAEAAQPCDLSHVWEEGATELPCSNLVRGKLFTTGLLAGPPSIDTEGLTLGPMLFKALEYRQRPPAWRGPLAVLINHDTASASELFVALLRDNNAATLIGERTDGTGCGYSNGGIQTVLQHSRFEVWVPDCVRHRRGGGSERAGIAPDLPVEWKRGQTARQRGARFLAQIERWVETL